MIIASPSACSSHPWVPVISTSPNQLSVFACHCIHGYGSPRYLLRLQREKIIKKFEDVRAKYASFSGQRPASEEETVVFSGRMKGWKSGIDANYRKCQEPLQPRQLCWWKLANEFLGGLISKYISHCLELSNIYLDNFKDTWVHLFPDYTRSGTEILQ